MSDPTGDLEQRLREHFADEQLSMRAPVDLWAHVETRLSEPTNVRDLLRRRWLPLAATAAAALAIAIGLLFTLGRSGGGSPVSAEKVLAGALAALNDPESVGLRSFQGEAEISASLTSGPDDPPGLPMPFLLRLWFEAPNRYREEFEYAGPFVGPTPTMESSESLLILTVSDGENLWRYEPGGGTNDRGDPLEGTYSRAQADGAAFLDTFQLVMPSAAAGGGGISGLLEAFQSELPGVQASLASAETLLGRAVYVVEITFPATSTSCAGAGRLWIDQKFLVTLRMQYSECPEEGSFEMQFTEIEFNGDISDDLFLFTPPPGATEITAVGGLEVPPGFLAPDYLPRDYEQSCSSGGGTTGAGGETLQYSFDFDTCVGDGHLKVNQERTCAACPPPRLQPLRQGNETTINGHEAWLQQRDGERTLAWQDGDIVIVLTANRLSEEELIRIAESMKPWQAGQGVEHSTPEGEGPP